MNDSVRPWMNDELSMMRDAAARLLMQEMVPQRARWDREGIVDRASWRKLGEAGLLCPSLPDAYGGGGGTLAHEIVMLEELSRCGLDALAGGYAIHSSIVPHYILAYATEAQKRSWLPKLAAGEAIGALAMSEPGAGSDVQGIKTRAKRDGDYYLISGSKIFISNGQNADYILVACKTDVTEGAKGISLIVLETNEPAQATGFRRGRNLEKIGYHSQDTSELFFEEVRVPAANLLGQVEGCGFAQLMTQLAWERLIAGINAAVHIEGAVAMATEYTKNRRAFGKRIFDFQNTQFKLAEGATIASVARIFIDQLIVRLLGGELDPVSAAKAKLWLTEQEGRVVDECLQLFGGYGYMLEYPIARLYTDIRLNRIVGGSSEIMKTIIARSL